VTPPPLRRKSDLHVLYTVSTVSYNPPGRIRVSITHLVRINYTPLRFLLFCIYTILGAGDTSQSRFLILAVGALNAVTTFDLVDL